VDSLGDESHEMDETKTNPFPHPTVHRPEPLTDQILMIGFSVRQWRGGRERGDLLVCPVVSMRWSGLIDDFSYWMVLHCVLSCLLWHKHKILNTGVG